MRLIQQHCMIIVRHSLQHFSKGFLFHLSLPFLGLLCHLPSRPAGELFAQAPVEDFPGITVETVSDSSRYFVLRIQDDNGEDVNINQIYTSQTLTGV